MTETPEQAALVEACAEVRAVMERGVEGEGDWDSLIAAHRVMFACLAALEDTPVRPKGLTFGSGHKRHCPTNLNGLAKCECEGAP